MPGFEQTSASSAEADRRGRGVQLRRTFLCARKMNVLPRLFKDKLSRKADNECPDSICRGFLGRLQQQQQFNRRKRQLIRRPAKTLTACSLSWKRMPNSLPSEGVFSASRSPLLSLTAVFAVCFATFRGGAVDASLRLLSHVYCACVHSGSMPIADVRRRVSCKCTSIP